MKLSSKYHAPNTSLCTSFPNLHCWLTGTALLFQACYPPPEKSIICMGLVCHSIWSWLIFKNYLDSLLEALKTIEEHSFYSVFSSTFNTTSLCLAGRLESDSLLTHTVISLWSPCCCTWKINTMHRDSRCDPSDSPGLSSQESEGGGAETDSNKSSETLHLYKYLLI